MFSSNILVRGSWIVLSLFAGVLGMGCGNKSEPKAELTFHKDVASVIHNHCAPCHRPGQNAPFDLLTYEDVSRRARQVAEVVESRYMPPWLPAPGYNRFQHDRSLTEDQVQLIVNWVEQGAVEGDASEAPPMPAFQEGWKMGAPDLVVRLEEPYELPADGPDVYRNFVISLPFEEEQPVLAMEFKPNAGIAVHHAFFAFDVTSESRKKDDADPEPGFDGIHMPSTAETPDRHFFSWQPGKHPMGGTPDRAWTIQPGTDLVFQLHMQPTGKPERIQPEIAFTFADQPGTMIGYKVGLSDYHIRIPAGTTNYVAEDSLVLPVDVELLGILPHAHYLATEMQGVATLPDGTSRWLLRIPRWDFNWQGEYMYEEPVKLPAGTTIGMRFYYDNTTNNPSNPTVPPKTVRYGLQSTDEMAELWFLFRLNSEEERKQLNDAYLPYVAQDIITYNRMLLEEDPGNATSWLKMGRARAAVGNYQEAAADLMRATQLDPLLDEAYYHLGDIAFRNGDLQRAEENLSRAVQLNPDNYKNFGYLGLIHLHLNNLVSAEASLQQALELNPYDTVAQNNLKVVRSKLEEQNSQ